MYELPVGISHRVPASLGILQCPWHGYRFDLRTGLSADGRCYRLAPAVRVDVDATTGEAVLKPLYNAKRR